jgi:ribonuclease R
VFNEKAHLLKGETTRQVYRLGDRVQVQLVRADLERRQLDFALVDVLERVAERRGARPERPRGSGRAPARRPRKR